MNKPQDRIALLIDAENVSKKYVKLIMDELSEYGVVTHKRVYGDFTNGSVLSWKENLAQYAMTPVFQFNSTKGKNASDSAMIIDAMDILYSGNVDGFCMVTSDSDFTKLAIRLSEAGMHVIGMGEQKTPASLVSACQSFKFLDLLYKDAIINEKDESEEQSMCVRESQIKYETKKTESKADSDYSAVPDRSEIEKEIASIISSKSGENEWVNLADVGNMLGKRISGFDPRNYGYCKLRDLVNDIGCFDIRDDPNPRNEFLKIVYVRNK